VKCCIDMTIDYISYLNETYYIYLFYFSFFFTFFVSAYDTNLEDASNFLREFLLRTTIFKTIKYRIICSFLKSQDMFEIKTSASLQYSYLCNKLRCIKKNFLDSVRTDSRTVDINCVFK
jgi:hypothetical protein